MSQTPAEDVAPVAIRLAFLPKKLPRVLTPGLLTQAQSAGLQLVALDPHKPISTALQQQHPAARAPSSVPHQHQPIVQKKGQQQQQEGAPADVQSLRCNSSAHGSSSSTGAAALDIILHKLPEDRVWASHLANYQLLQPNVRVLDPPAAIAATRDRTRMLTAVPATGLELRVPVRQPAPPPSPQLPVSDVPQETSAGDCDGAVSVVRLRVPPQVLLTSRDDLIRLVAAAAGEAAGVTAEAGPPEAGVAGDDMDAGAGGKNVVAMAAAGPTAAVGAGMTVPRPPFILKTQSSDVAGDSGHGLAVALGWGDLVAAAEQLQQCAAASGDRRWVPLVVQQYVPHSEALYKVYVLGTEVRVERRPSLTTHRMSTMKQQQQRQQQHQQEQQQANHAQQNKQPVQSDPQTGPPPPPQLENPQQAQRFTDHHPTHCRPPPAVLSGPDAAPFSSVPPSHTPPLPPPLPGRAALLLHGLSANRDGDRQQQRRQQEEVEEGSSIREGSVGSAPPHVQGTGNGTVAAVDEQVLTAIAQELSTRMDLTMFNFDLVVPDSDHDGEEEEAGGEDHGGGGEDQGGKSTREVREQQLYVVDVNYFPGYDKLPGWEGMLVRHLRAVADKVVAARVASGG